MNTTRAQYQNNSLVNIQNNFQNNIQNNITTAPAVVMCEVVNIHNPGGVPKRANSRQNRQNRRNRERRHRAERQRLWRQIRNLKRRIRKSQTETRNIHKLDQCYEERTAEGASYKYEIKSETSMP